MTSLSGPDESFEVTATEANYQVAAKQPQAVLSRPSLRQYADPSRRGRKRSFVSRNPSLGYELSQNISRDSDEGPLGQKYYRTRDYSVPNHALDFASSNSPPSTVRIGVDNYQTFPISPQHVLPVEDDLFLMHPTSLPRNESYSIPNIYSYQPDVPFPADVPVGHNPVSDPQRFYEPAQQYPFYQWNVSSIMSPSSAENLSPFSTSREVDSCLPSSSADVHRSDSPMSSDFGQYK